MKKFNKNSSTENFSMPSINWVVGILEKIFVSS